MKIGYILFPSVFSKLQIRLMGRSFLMCSQDQFFGTNKIGPLKTDHVNGPLKAKVFYLTSRIMEKGGFSLVYYVHFANSESLESLV